LRCRTAASTKMTRQKTPMTIRNHMADPPA
jgi:hypothetical protein